MIFGVSHLCASRTEEGDRYNPQLPGLFVLAMTRNFPVSSFYQVFRNDFNWPIDVALSVVLLYKDQLIAAGA
jgi:hypothetical protein